MSAKPIVIGFTGSFGSGCTTFANTISSTYKFDKITLSDRIKEEVGPKATRESLQKAGDAIREKEGNAALSEWAIEQARKQYPNSERLIFDSIRHTDEVKNIRANFPAFLLVAVDAPRDQRWKRVAASYSKQRLTEDDFDLDDQRDREESDLPHGQQVRKCTAMSDIILDNSEADTLDHNIERLKNYIDPLLDPSRFKLPTRDELNMNHAYLVSRMSRCLQRQVGSSIVGPDNCLISSGFNDVPATVTPCREYPVSDRNCFRRYVRTCPSCRILAKPVRNCPECGRVLEEYAKSAKDMDLCRAVHAEENAILQAANSGVSLRGCTLYTTTFPCLLCAKKIINTGIKRVVYIDPYPVRQSWDMLREAGIILTRYSGTTPWGYVRLYGNGL